MEESKTTQCWECRQRRLVCDYTQPKCRKCRARGVICPGYDGKRPLKWLQLQQINAKGPEKMAVPRTIKPAGEQQTSAIVEAIEYYNMRVAPDLSATGAGGPGSPYWLPNASASYMPPTFIHNLVCTALCHRILQSGSASPSDQRVLARRFQKHRSDALRALTADLSHPEHQTSDVTLISVIVLLLVELQRSFEPPNWRHHTKFAGVMIDNKGGLGHLVFTRPYVRHIYRYYALVEVMGNTTSPHVEVDSARNHLEQITLLPVLYGNGLSTCFPCPPDLLAEIIRINHFRSLFGGVSRPEDQPGSTMQRESRHTAGLDVLRRIRAFKTGRWAAEVVVGLSSSEDSAGFRGWEAIARAYQSAIAIYCIASLFGAADIRDNSVPPDSVLVQAREACRLVLVDRLREVSKCTQLRKLVLWPLFVAGVEAEDEATRRFIVAELQWISNALGTATPLVAKDLLEKRVWVLRLGRGDWDCLFDQSYVFVL